MSEDVWYRIENHLVSAGVDEFDNPLGPAQMSVHLAEFKLIKRTSKGVWLNVYGVRRFVLDSARKRYACATVEEAKASFEARKRRQISILMRQVRNAERAIELARPITAEKPYGIWGMG